MNADERRSAFICVNPRLNFLRGLTPGYLVAKVGEY
jgi:hypothetical protein